MKGFKQLKKAVSELPCEPRHEKTYFMSYANNKGADQPVNPGSLISTFLNAHSLDSMIPIVAMYEISGL